MRAGMRSSISASVAAASAAMIAVMVLWAVPASARPHPPLDVGPRTFILPATDYCTNFDVLWEWVDTNQYVISSSTTADDVTTLRVTGHASVRLTNLANGKTVSYNVSGPGTLTINPDFSFSVAAGGPNLLYTTKASSFPGVPPLSYTTGRVTFSVDADGVTTAYSLKGRRTDVCAVLA